MPRKTLFCVIAQTREHEIVWDSVKRNVLDVLDADLAVCIATPTDYDYSNPYWQNAKYKWTTPEYEDWFATIESVKNTVYPQASDNWKKIIQVPDNWFAPANGHRGAGAILIFYRWYLMVNLMIENIFSKYDRVIVSRSDYRFMCPHPPVENMDPKYVWIPDGEQEYGMTDRYAILSEYNAVSYLNVLHNILCHSSVIEPHLGGWCNLERILKLNLNLTTGTEDNTRTFPFIMYSVRSEGTPTRWAPGYWNEQLGHYIKYPNEFELANYWAGIIKTPDDWNRQVNIK